jgi:hypothetical protein
LARAAGVLRFAAVLVRAGFAFAGFFFAIAMMFLIRRWMRRECEEDHNFNCSSSISGGPAAGEGEAGPPKRDL